MTMPYEQDLFGYVREIPMMPTAFQGKTTKNGGYTKNAPRKWTEEEIDWCISLRDKGYSTSEIAKSVGRDQVSVQIKMKRIKKGEYNYNQGHAHDKYACNEKFTKHIKPQTILDVYAGLESWYKDGKVISNDINPSANTTCHDDAFRFICSQYITQGADSFDLVDLDPFGSAYDSFDIAIKMARKGLVVTFGEMRHKRWKRLDFVSRYYKITTLADFTIGRMIEEVQAIAMRNKKRLTPIIVKEWQNIGRVWFEVEKVKIL